MFSFGPFSARKEDTEVQERVQRRAVKLVKAVEHKSYGKRLRELGCSVWRRLRGDRVALYNNPEGGCSKVGVGLSSQVTATGQEGTALSCTEGRCRLDMGQFFL